MIFAALSAAFPGARLSFYITLFLVTFFSLTAVAQGDIYIESFEIDGIGVAGECTSTNIASCATNVPDPDGLWSLNGDFSELNNAGDFIQTSGGSLVAQDINREICFLSSVIDISSYENLVLELGLREEGDLETSDYIDVTYILDGAPTLIANFNGFGNSVHTLIGVTGTDPDWQSANIRESIANGSTLQIEVCFKNNVSSEQYFFDQISVRGDEIPDVIPTMSQWTLFILGLLMANLAVVLISIKGMELN